jgi:hypothetical protein
MIGAQSQRALRVQRIDRAAAAIASGRKGTGKLKRAASEAGVCVDLVIGRGIRHNEDRPAGPLLRDSVVRCDDQNGGCDERQRIG